MTRSYISASPLREIGIVAERSLIFAAAIAAPLVVGGIIVAEPLLVAVFGGDYAAGKMAFQFLTVGVGFLFLHGAIHNIFLVLNRLKTEMIIFAAAATVNVGLNIFVIPRYGIAGAAVVTALAEFITLVCGLIVINRIGVSFSILPIWRPILASSVMGVCLIAVGTNWGLFFYVGLGCSVYILALLALRGIPQDARPFFQTPGSFVSRLLRSTI
jgi:O-antigen/teichoic acid export membrane protein